MIYCTMEQYFFFFYQTPERSRHCHVHIHKNINMLSFDHSIRLSDHRLIYKCLHIHAFRGYYQSLWLSNIWSIQREMWSAFTWILVWKTDFSDWGSASVNPDWDHFKLKLFCHFLIKEPVLVLWCFIVWLFLLFCLYFLAPIDCWVCVCILFCVVIV